jgi:hypothetical protein
MGSPAEILGTGLRLTAPDDDPAACRLLLTDAVLSQSLTKIFVVFTDAKTTKAALNAAARWADELKFEIELIVPHVVPYPLPSASPTIPATFTTAEIRRLISDSGVTPDVHIYLCRDRLQVLRTVLPPRSTVVIGARRGWLPSAAGRLARKLRQIGHLALVVRPA